MQFLLLAYDAQDDAALGRRMAARDAHLKLVDENKTRGHAKFGAALLQDGKMVGSMMVVDYPSREALEEWLKVEPYITGKVWEKITISECKIAPSFM